MSAVSVFVLRPVFDRLTIEPIARYVGDLPALGRFALALLLFDLVSYGVHRGLHKSDLLWNIHKVHHSSLELDGLAATRQHMLENLIRFVPGQIAMFLVGIPTAQVAPAVAIGAAFAVIDHSNIDLDLRFMEKLFITPRLHRRHHSPVDRDEQLRAASSTSGTGSSEVSCRSTPPKRNASAAPARSTPTPSGSVTLFAGHRSTWRSTSRRGEPPAGSTRPRQRRTGNEKGWRRPDATSSNPRTIDATRAGGRCAPIIGLCSLVSRRRSSGRGGPRARGGCRRRRPQPCCGAIFVDDARRPQTRTLLERNGPRDRKTCACWR